MKRSRRKILWLRRTANSSTLCAFFLISFCKIHIYFIMLVFMHIAEKDNTSPGNRVVIFGLVSDCVLFSLEHKEC